MLKIKQYQIKPEIFDNPLLGIHLKSMRLYGFISGSDQRYQLWHFVRCTFFTLSFVAFTTINFIQVMRGIHILLADFLLRPTTVLEICLAIHAVNGYFQRERVVRLVNFVHEDLLAIRSYTDPLENEIFSKTVKYLRRLTLMLTVPTFCNGFILTLQTLFLTILSPEMMYYKKWNGTAHTVMLIESFPFGEVLDNFILGYLGSFYAVTMTVFAIPIMFIFYSCLMQFLIFKIEILGKRFSEMNLMIFDPGMQIMNENEYLVGIEKNILRLKMCEYCGEELIKIRWFVKELQELVRIPIFLDSLIFSILLCVLLYLLSTGGLSAIEYWYTFMFMANSAAIQLIHHWHATTLTKTHAAISFAIYSCDWYNYPLKLQKAIRLIMMDASRPLIMNALLVDLKLETVLDIFRGAFSYYSILRKLKT